MLPWQRGDLAQVHRRLRSLEGRQEEHSAAFARGVAERVACELETGGALSSHFWSRLMGRVRDANSELASRVYDLEGSQQSCNDLIQVCCWWIGVLYPDCSNSRTMNPIASSKRVLG